MPTGMPMHLGGGGSSKKKVRLPKCPCLDATTLQVLGAAHLKKIWTAPLVVEALLTLQLSMFVQSWMISGYAQNKKVSN
jgi:hypothetical protein